MRIIFQYEKTRRTSIGFLSLSRILRQAEYEIADVLRELRTETEFETCKKELREQEEATILLTARIVSLSTALNEIAELYGRAETRNVSHMDGASKLYRPSAPGAFHQGGDIRERMDRILYPQEGHHEIV